MKKSIENNTYFFKFIPISLQQKAKKPKFKLHSSKNVQTKFVLYLDNYKFQQKDQWLQAQFIQNILKCPNQAIDFHIKKEATQDYSTISIQILIRQPKQKIEQQLQQINNNQCEFKVSQLGNCQLDLQIYIQTFIDDSKRVYQQNVQISSDLSMNYEVYMERQISSLQRLVAKCKGPNNQGSILISAFKKIQGHRKIRYVQLYDNKQESVQQEQFKKSHKLLIKSLKKKSSSNKYTPYKIVTKSSLGTESTPRNIIQKKIDIQKQATQISFQENFAHKKHKSLQVKIQAQGKIVKKRLASNSVYIQKQSKNSQKLQKKILVKRKLVEERIYEKWMVMVFCIFSVFLLYMCMFPSKKV